MIKKQVDRKRGKFASDMPYSGGYGAANLWQSGTKTSEGDNFAKKMPKPKKKGKKIN